MNLIGEHVDYNDGFVLPMAIDRYCVVAAAPRDDVTVRVYSADLDDEMVCVLDDSITPGDKAWARYVEGVVARFQMRDYNEPGFDAVINSMVPIGSGLSSSAAMEMTIVTAMEQMCNVQLDPLIKVKVCIEAEHIFAGVPCGVMDQMSSAFGAEGQCMLIDCRSQDVELVPFASPKIGVLITNTNVKHEHTSGEYAKRRAQCDSALKAIGKASWRDVCEEDLIAVTDAAEHKRAQHVVSEIARTLDAVEALRTNDWTRFGELMYKGHASLRDDYEVSCPELDAIVEAARAIGVDGGVYGSRMTGGGFGGCAVTLVETAKVGSITAAIHDRYQRDTGIAATSYISRPARGAHGIPA